MSSLSRSSSQASLLTPSEDFDMSNVKTKPPPRQPVDPTYRGWKEVGGFEEEDVLTAEDETVDLLSRGSLLTNIYLQQSMETGIIMLGI